MPAPGFPGNESLMPARLPNLGWAPRAALLAALLSLTAACGPKRDVFAPPCPGQAILGDAANFDAYRPSNNAGAVSDLTDLVLHARIVGIQGSCQPGDRKDQLAVTASVGVDLTRGPAMVGREIDVPVFVAVTEGGSIVDKHVYLVHVAFPSNVDRITLTPGGINLLLPVTSEKTGAAYTIVAGFQLSPDQIARNRRS